MMLEVAAAGSGAAGIGAQAPNAISVAARLTSATALRRGALLAIVTLAVTPLKIGRQPFAGTVSRSGIIDGQQAYPLPRLDFIYR
jgi:hypothetical protein